MELSPEAATAGYRLIALDRTTSTNDEGRHLAESGDAGNVWITADDQTAGRGRHGRVWTSPSGNLHASLLLNDPCPLATASELGFVAGLALHDAVAGLTNLKPPRLTLKWPNDLLVDGAKAAGLLLEGVPLPSGKAAVVIGIGCNVAHVPDDAPYPVFALTQIVPDLTVARLFAALSAGMIRRLAEWRGKTIGAPTGFASIRGAWLARAAGVDTVVTVRGPAGERRGRFVGLDETGRLELFGRQGIERVDAGDLFLGPELFGPPHSTQGGA